MFRKRLRSVTGCLRCRQRRVKCDEQHPRCSYCQKWNLICTWPASARPSNGTTSNVARTDLRTAAETRHGVDGILLAHHGLIRQSAVEPFGQLTYPVASGWPNVGGLDEVLCSEMVSTYTLFDVALDLQAWSANLLGWTMSDDALYPAFVAWCASVQREQINGRVSSRWQLEMDVRTVSVLRQRIESGTRPTETTILAATYHFFKMLRDSNADVLHSIARGIYILLESRGEFRLFSLEFQFWTLLSLWGFDSFMSILCVRRPSLLPDNKLYQPQSFAEMYERNKSVEEELHDHLDSEIMEAIEEMKFLLYFKHPSRKSRFFTRSESFYLIQATIIFDLHLADLQARYLRQNSASEVIVLSLLLTKVMLLGGNLRHPLLISNILQRLSNAILSSDLERYTTLRMIKLWACFVAVVGSEFSDVRTSFTQLALSILTKMYGDRSWPVQWRDMIHEDFRSFIWHCQFDSWFLSICDAVEIMRQIKD